MHRPEIYKDLPVWQKSVELACKVYAVTRKLPSDERDCLVRQLRRTSIRIATNVADAAAPHSRTELRRLLCIARGSLSELEVGVLVATHQGLLADEHSLPQSIAEVRGLLGAWSRELRAAALASHARACMPP